MQHLCARLANSPAGRSAQQFAQRHGSRAAQFAQRHGSQAWQWAARIVARELAARSASGILMRSEAAGGHLIARHVGLTTPQLAGRLAGNARLRVASTFNTLGEAQGAVTAALRANTANVSNWIGQGAQGRLVIDAPFSGGTVLARGASSPVSGTGVRLVLQGNGNGNFHILTGFPVP